MTKKIIKFISLTLVFCMLNSTVLFAAESETLKNMTYEEWLTEQEGVDPTTSMVQSELEPVEVTFQKQEKESNIPQVYNSGKNGNKLLDTILKEKGNYKLNEKINVNLKAKNVIASITSEEEEVIEPDSSSEMDTVIEEDSSSETDTVSEEVSSSEMDTASEINTVNESESVDETNLSNNSELIRTAPTADLIPIIINEDSLVNGEITTDTLIAFLFNDTDVDGDAIVNRYVDGTAVNYILGSIDGGFVMQITDPGNYQLYYQVEDSAGEFSRILVYAIDVIQAPIIEPYQVFEGSFSSADDTVTYNFSVDFSEMSSAAVCLVRKGYVGTSIEVFDESGNQVLLRGTGARQAKNWGFIDKPSNDSTICNYTVVAKPNSYEDRASNYRIVIGNKNDTELMMSGIENTVLLDQYYEAKVNLENSVYVPNVGEYWFKYKRESTSVITIQSDVSDIRFKLLDANTLKLRYDSAMEADTHKTSFIGTGWTCAEKARLNSVVGEEYYLVVYCTNPNTNLSLRTGSMGTAVGNPVMWGGRESTSVSPGKSVTLKDSGYSAAITCDVSNVGLPKTAQVKDVDLNVSPSLVAAERWSLKAPNLSYWVTNPESFWNSIDMDYKYDSSDNAYLKGAWSAVFLASSSGKGKTITPSYKFYYIYECGD